MLQQTVLYMYWLIESLFLRNLTFSQNTQAKNTMQSSRFIIFLNFFLNNVWTFENYTHFSFVYFNWVKTEVGLSRIKIIKWNSHLIAFKHNGSTLYHIFVKYTSPWTCEAVKG